MSLLHDIQASVVQQSSDIGSILLKLRLLASRLGSVPLEEWIKHETEGYPRESEVPSYRVIEVNYSGTFFGPYGSGIKNAQLPPYLIEKFAGESWTKYKMRDSVAIVDELLRKPSDNESAIGIDASNLILLLQGKIYENYTCNDIQARISQTSIAGIQYAVRSRILELTIELEKSVPGVSEIKSGLPEPETKVNTDKVTQITKQIIFGDVTTISNIGQGSQTNLSIAKRNDKVLIDKITSAGIPESAAS